jgi:ABC-type antimicrobial peptide transport system permease subunit
LTFVVRSTLDDAVAIDAARRVVRAVDRDVALTQVTSLRQAVTDSLGDHRLQTAVLASFAGLALFLAALGIYGVLAYFVAQRSRELGIRLALGAHPRELFAMVVAQGMRPVGLGALIGIAAAIALTRLMASLLFGITPLDPVSYASTVGVLALSALVACALPAARATRVDPLVALRDE